MVSRELIFTQHRNIDKRARITRAKPQARKFTNQLTFTEITIPPQNTHDVKMMNFIFISFFPLATVVAAPQEQIQTLQSYPVNIDLTQQ